jgi:hypothetical protein
MKYLCLGYHDANAWRSIDENERQALLEECRAFDEELWKKGYPIRGNALPGIADATTLRFENGRVAVTEGPVIEAKEQLGGILLLEADDLNHAIQLMSQLPCMRLGGSLEIRPLIGNDSLTGAPT